MRRAWSANREAPFSWEWLGNDRVALRVEPVPVLGPIATILFHTGLGILTIFTFGIGAILAIFLWLYVYRWGRYSRGRRSSKFWVDREGITTPEDEYLARADIARLYVWAPGREPAFLHAGLASTGTLTGPGTGERSLLGIADRAWMLVAEAGGREHWLAGGMRQVTAYGVLHEISRVFAGTAQPGI